MKLVKQKLLTILPGIFILIAIYPFSSSIAAFLKEPPANSINEMVTYLPLILFERPPQTLTFVAGPIQSVDDLDDIYTIKKISAKLTGFDILFYVFIGSGYYPNITF